MSKVTKPVRGRTRIPPNLKVYLDCSLLRKSCRQLAQSTDLGETQIILTAIETPAQISFIDEASSEKGEIVVPLWPAGPCPGSTMFLSQVSNRTVVPGVWQTGKKRSHQNGASALWGQSAKHPECVLRHCCLQYKILSNS